IRRLVGEPKPEAKAKLPPELEGLVGRIKLPGPQWALADLGPNYCPELSRKAPLDIAKRFTADKLTYHAKGRASQPGTFFYQDRWWQWNGSFYEKAPERRLIDMICGFLDQSKVRSEEEGGELRRFRPTPRDLSGVLTFLRSNVGIDDRVLPPKWF